MGLELKVMKGAGPLVPLASTLCLALGGCGEGGFFDSAGSSETGSESGSGGQEHCPEGGWNQGVARTPNLAEAVMTALDDIAVHGLASGDFDGDGDDDLVIVEFTKRALYLSSNGDGSFAAPVEIATPGPTTVHIGSVQVADLDGDGVDDLALGYQSGEVEPAVVGVHWGGSDFPGARSDAIADVLNISADSFGLGDLDGDGAIDIGAQSKVGAYVIFGAGDRSFGDMRAVESPFGTGYHVGVADLDDDGRAEMMLTTLLFTYRFYDISTSRSVSFRDLPGWGALGGAPRWQDLNGDNAADLAVGGDTHVYVAWNDGDGNFGAYQAGEYCTAGPEAFSFGGHPHFGVADLDGDGELDIAVGEQEAHELAFLYGQAGDRDFREFGRLPAATYDPSAIVPGDYNGDGIVDLGVLYDSSPDDSFGVHLGQ